MTLVFATVAVKTAVLGAEAAGLFQSLAQLCSGAMAAHFEIILGDSQARRCLFQRNIVQVDHAQRLGVFWLQSRDRCTETVTDVSEFDGVDFKHGEDPVIEA